MRKTPMHRPVARQFAGSLPRITLPLITLLLVTLPMVGCGKGDAGQAQGQLDQAIAIIDRAEQGFVPRGEKTATLAEFRQEKFAQAQTLLDSAVTKAQGSHKLATARLQAALQASRAKAAGRTLTAQWGQLANEGATVLTYMSAILRAEFRADPVAADTPSLMAALTEYRQSQGQRVDTLTARLTELEDQLTQLRSKAAEHAAQRDAQMAESADHRDASFGARGEAKLELQLAAIQASRRAAQANASRDTVLARIGVAEGEQRVLITQRDAAQAAVARVEQQMTELREQDQQVAQAIAEARAARQEAVDTFTQAYNALTQRMNEQVIEPMALVHRDLEAVVQTLSGVQSLAKGADSRDVKLDLLAAKADLLFSLARYAQILGNYGQTLATIAQTLDRVLPERSSEYARNANGVVDAQRQVIEQATTLTQEARTLAQELAQGGGDSAARAEGYLSRINTWSQAVTNTSLR